MKQLLSLAMVCLYMMPINSMQQPKVRYRVKERPEERAARIEQAQNPINHMPIRTLPLEVYSPEVRSFHQLFEELVDLYTTANNKLRAYAETIADPYQSKINALCNQIDLHHNEATRTLERLQKEQFSFYDLKGIGLYFELLIERSKTECHQIALEMHLEGNNDHPILMYEQKSEWFKLDLAYEKKRLDAYAALKDIIRNSEQRYNAGHRDEYILNLNAFVHVAERLPVEGELASLNANPFSAEIILNMISGQRETNRFFYGPQGTGKTQLAQAIAQRAGRPCIMIDIPAFLDAYNGNVALFSSALNKICQQNVPCVIVLDKFDTPDKNEQREKQYFFIRRALRTYIHQHVNENIMLIETASRRESLPQNARHLTFAHELSLPNQEQRFNFLKKAFENIDKNFSKATITQNCNTDAYIRSLARRTHNFSYPNLQKISQRDLYFNALRRTGFIDQYLRRPSCANCPLPRVILEKEDFENVLKEEVKSLPCRKRLFGHFKYSLQSIIPTTIEALRPILSFHTRHKHRIHKLLKTLGAIGSSVAGTIAAIKIGKKHKNVTQRVFEVAKHRWQYTLAGAAIVGTASVIGIKKYAWPRFKQWQRNRRISSMHQRRTA